MFKVLHSDYFADTYPGEWTALQKHFSPEALITDLDGFREGDLILPRYRTAPFGEFLQAAAEEAGARLINSFQESARVRDIFAWAHLLEEMTAPALSLTELTAAPEGEFFVKGQTSSLKNRGPEFAFVKSKAEAFALAQELQADSWLSGEKIVVRPLQDYLLLGHTPKGLPIFHERRVFLYRGQVLADSFYWSSFRARLKTEPPALTANYHTAVAEAAKRVQEVAPFLVMDMAQYTDGHWGVVELNDACQAGVSGACEDVLYGNTQSTPPG